MFRGRCLALGILITVLQNYECTSYRFPHDFMFGTATSAYQIEGAWNESGKGENIWDRFTHREPYRISDQTTGDIACDSYHKYKEDIALLKKLGVDFYRLSLSWSRILPTGYINQINEEGINYYNNVIDELIKNNITPMVTLYHWDLPEPLHEAGGWTSPFLAEYFEDFAWVAFKYFGDRVKLWITINEPYHVCISGYATGIFAPGYNSSGIGNYHCVHTVLLAHARAYHLYNNEFRPYQKGRIGITLDSFWYEPNTKSFEDVQAADLALQMNFGIFAHPIFTKKGGFPPAVEEQVEKKSREEYFRRSRLPKLSEKVKEYIKGTSDFFGLNHYSTFLVSNEVEPGTNTNLFNIDLDISLMQDPEWEKTPASWITIVPWGLRKLLKYIKDNYNNPTVIITENGLADDTEELNDVVRVRYMNQYLGAVLESIYEDKVQVKAYSAWSFMDNFEWWQGYTLKFGLHHVDFQDPNLKRTPKASAVYYKKVIATRRVDHPFTPIVRKT